MTMLCSRFVSFISSLENLSKICIRLLINLLKFDQMSVTAKNLRNIADKCNKDLNIIDKRIVKLYDISRNTRGRRMEDSIFK